MAGLSGNVRRGQLSNDVRRTSGPRRARAASGTRARHAAPAFPRLAGTGLEPLESRLLMSAVRAVAGFNTGNVGVGDDRSTVSAQSLGFAAPVNFFGSQYSGVFVNNNGNVSFGARNSSFVDTGLEGLAARVVAPFYADVETHAGSSTVRYGRSSVDGRSAFGVNWVNVDYYTGGHANHNSFQLVLIDRSDLGAGNFDMEFNYDQVLWESGINQNGGNADGLGGNTARVGFTSGTGLAGEWHEMAGSGVAGSFLDSNLGTGLAHGSFMSDEPGRYVFRFRDGIWADAPTTGGTTNTAPAVNLTSFLELEESADGTTRLEGVSGLFDDPDADTWTVTVDYGDNTGTQVLDYNNGKMFLLDHTYNAATTYSVTVTVDDGQGGVSSAVMGVQVRDVSAPVFDVVVNPGTDVSEGGTVTIFSNADNDGDLNDFHSYDWVGDGVVSDDGRSFTLAATDNGTYTVRAIVRDQSGNESYQDVTIVAANVAPTASGFTVNAGASVDEGAAFTVSLEGADDASAADLAAGLTYSFDLDGDGVYELSGASASATHLFDDNGAYIVRGRVTDKDGGHSDYEMTVLVTNVAPAATGLSGSQAEAGGAVTVSFGPASDASGADLAAGLTYGFDFDGDGVYEVSGASSTASHLYENSGTYVIRGRVEDKDGGSSEYEASLVVVANRAPTATFVAGDNAVEGNVVGFSLQGASDSDADLAAGLTYSFDLDGDGVYELSGTSAAASHVFGDNGTYTVNARVSDVHGAHSDYSATVVVANAAPTGTLPVEVLGNEGGVITVTLGNVADASTADLAAGLTYGFDFDNDGVYEVTRSAPAAGHVFDDNGRYTVGVRVTDKDGGHSDYTTQVKVRNVAPHSKKFWDNNPVAEGTVVTVGFDAVDDPSDADSAAGFTYSYDFDNDGTFDVVSTSPMANHRFADNGVFVVVGRVTDKDGDFEDYTTDVEVYNVAPTARLTASAPALEGGTVTLRLDGAADAAADLAAGLTYSFDLNNDGVYEVTGSSPSVGRSFVNEGAYTVRAKVTDKDGGSNEYFTVVNVANVAPTVTSVSNSASTFGAARQGSMVLMSASFADAGVLDTHTAVIDWGDGTTSNALLGESGGRGVLGGGHVYAKGGIYTVTLRLRDNAATPGVTVATTKAIITGVGLHNGVLQVVGTNSSDKVTLDADNKGNLKVKGLVNPDPSFSLASVKEVQVWLGAGSDRLELKGTISRPVYYNGGLYHSPSGSSAARPGTTTVSTKPAKGRLFSEVLVAA